jgi:hypothetical protein
MHTGALMAVRQFLGQYLVYAKPWHRALIAALVIAGATALIAAGIVTGHVTMTVVGGLVLLGTGHACVRITLALGCRRRGRPYSHRETGAGRTTGRRGDGNATRLYDVTGGTGLDRSAEKAF